ncbi:substrate-binding domain-containing protein [Salinibacterium sp. ZJ70]|uniref:sugar ABC transporter substrate-binding protein n=1 Tax=Salinibacterium sp. ZJ70 TaxID=2708084 RepID=UPI00142135C9|nr:substrate-binding domain-containing protein [Salinibacterium sp. ZJ70]
MTKKSVLIGALALTAVLLTGCTAPAGGDDVPVNVEDAVAKKAAEFIAPYLERPSSIGIEAPFVGEIPTDKEIYWLQCSSPACAVVGGAIEEAVTSVGWTLKVVDAGLSPESVKAAWNQAVLGDPDAVIASGFTRAIYEPELQALAERGVPVLNMTTAEAPENGILSAQRWGPDFNDVGERLANYLLSLNGEQTNAVAFTISAFPNIALVGEAFGETIAAQCSSCSLDVVDLPVDALGGDLPNRVVTYLQANPDVNSVYVGYSDMMVGLPTALQAAGISKSVRFVTLDTSPTTSVYLENGDYLAAVDASPTYEMSFRHVDFLLRHFTGADTTPSNERNNPAWVITQDSLPTSADHFPLVVDYAEQYRTLWGLGK